MSTKPILFNTEMVKAILDGRKTVTRRLVKNPPNNVYSGRCALGAGLFDEATHIRIVEPPFKIGDILYVRETFTEEDKGRYYYRADFDSDLMDPCETLSGGYPAECRHRNCDTCSAGPWRIRWKPSIHMPKEAARIFLRVKNVRVERLQDITADECPMEGVWPLASCTVGERDTYYRSKFAELWDSTIKPADMDTYGWEANPWVWVIKFEKISKEEVE